MTAQSDPADRRLFVLDAERWAEFNAILDRPSEVRPGLAALLARKPAWTDSGQSDLLELIALGSATGTSDAEWRIFEEALYTAADEEGRIMPNTLRPLIRGVVSPKRIGAFHSRAVKRGLVEFDGGWQISDDREGGNAGRPARTMRLL